MKIPKSVDRSYLIKELNPVDKGSYYLANCPSCGKRELYVYKNKDFMVCNRLNKCGYVNNILNYLKEDGLSKAEISKLLFSSDSIEEEVIEQQFITPLKNVNYFNSANKNFSYRLAYNYLKKRGIKDNVINELGYVSTNSSIKIYIPFYESDILVYYTLRDINKNAYLRWTDPKGINKHEYVYNLDNIKNTVFIFEGLMDALSLDSQIGTAMLTSNLGKVQITKIMEQSPKNIVLVPDMDKAGVLSIKKNINLLKEYTPPSLDVNILLYILDPIRYDLINNILSMKYNLIKENELINKLKGFKDFNETNRSYIDLKDCVNQDKKGIAFDLLKNFQKSYIKI